MIKKITFSAAAFYALLRHPGKSLKAVWSGVKEGIRKGVAGEPKTPFPSMTGRVVDVEICEQERRPPHKTYGFSNQIVEVKNDE